MNNLSIGLSLLLPNDTRAPNVPAMAAGAKKILGDSLDTFLLGNEPGMYILGFTYRLFLTFHPRFASPHGSLQYRRHKSYIIIVIIGIQATGSDRASLTILSRAMSPSGRRHPLAFVTPPRATYFLRPFWEVPLYAVPG
jgi:hypothetical protein